MNLFYIYGDLENNAKLRRLLFEIDGPHCVYCYKKFKTYQDQDVTIDHVVPRKFGGSNRLHNLVLSCENCNTMKASKGGTELSSLINYMWQKRRSREMNNKVKFETIPLRVLLRLPLEVKNGYIKSTVTVNERLKAYEKQK